MASEICRLRPPHPPRGAREKLTSLLRDSVSIADVSVPRTRSLTLHDLIKMRLAYLGKSIGRFESRRRGKTELCAAVVETLTRQ